MDNDAVWCELAHGMGARRCDAPSHPGRESDNALRFSWIIEGSEEQIVQGMPPKAAKAGDVIHEEPMQVSQSRNTGRVKFVEESLRRENRSRQGFRNNQRRSEDSKVKDGYDFRHST